MIHNSEDKLIKITLYKPSENYRQSERYSIGKVVWKDGYYWEFVGATPKQGSAPSDTNADWDRLLSRPTLDTGSISGMIIVLYLKGERKIIAKYSLNNATGFSDIDDTDSSLGVYKFYLLNTITTGIKEGIILAEIKVSQGDIGAPAGRLNTIATDIPITEINRPVTEYISVP